MSLNRRTVILSLGYIKLVLINLLELGIRIKKFYMLAIFLESNYVYATGGISRSILAIPITILAILLVDTSFCVVFLVGGHKRSRSILRVYFWLVIVGVIVAILRAGFYVGYSVAIIFTASEAAAAARDTLHNPLEYAFMFWIYLVNIAIQITLLVYVRREIRSIENVLLLANGGLQTHRAEAPKLF